VAEIVGVEKKEVFGRIQRFYVLQAMDSGLRILVPVDKADQVGLRRVAGENEIEEVLDILPRQGDPHRPPDLEPPLPRFHGEDQVRLAVRGAEVFRDLYRSRA